MKKIFFLLILLVSELTFSQTITLDEGQTLKVDRTLYDVKYGSASFFDGIKDKAIV